jgi:CheY-like chemotaxis protein
MANTQIRHAARLTVDLGQLPTVNANETRLGQVFLNLLVNAAQAIGEGSADKNEIRVRSFTDAAGRAVVEVQDSGPGIAPEISSKIFDPFFTTKPIGSGTGLGLSICQSIVVALSGSIEVVSELGKGALFRVVLPPNKIRRERKASAPLLPSLTRRRVLVVDDEPLICASFRKTLGEHDVITQVDSRVALEQIRNGARYDVIFCDLMMPDMNGIDFYEALRVSVPELLPRVVLMSGGVLNDRTRGFLVGNPNPFLDKPVRAKSVRRLVAESAPIH